MCLDLSFTLSGKLAVLVSVLAACIVHLFRLKKHIRAVNPTMAVFVRGTMCAQQGCVVCKLKRMEQEGDYGNISQCLRVCSAHGHLT